MIQGEGEARSPKIEMPREYISVAVKKQKNTDPETMNKALDDLKSGLVLRKCTKKHI